jgi:hypothetical protein
MKQLKQMELNQILASENKTKEAILELEILKLRQQVIQQKAKNFELIVSLKSKEIEEGVEKVSSLKKQHTEMMNEIKKANEIVAERWGYDPRTGEVFE